MRLRSQLFYVFLAVLLIVASIVEASKKRNLHKKRSNIPVLSILLFDHSSVGPGREIPVRHHSGPKPRNWRKQGTTRQVLEKASSTVEGSISGVVSSAVSGGGTKSRDDTMGVAFKEAVDGGNFGWLGTNWRRWDRS